ncbi:MAG: beta-lactamase family protein, partial [Actinobacteria bacterium]|nr:beta-lactamase family protein [Actinomycetota bacterium]
LLGLVLERASGKKIAELLNDEVFAPLGMGATALPSTAPAAPATTGTALKGFQSTKGADGVMNCTDPLKMTTMSSSVGSSAAGVVSDIQDVRTYVQALATKALMPENTQRFSNPVPVYDGAPAWLTTAGGAIQAGSLVGQFGAVPGYITAAFADPTTGLTVAVVLNNSAIGSSAAAALAWELAAIASKAPAASGQTAPAAGLPWTAQQFHDQITATAVCSAPAQ